MVEYNDQEEQQINFEYLTIPKEFFDLKLSGIEVMVLAMVKAFSKPPKYCFASNKYIGNIINISESSVSKAISRLIELKYVEKIKFDGRKRIIYCDIRTIYHDKKRTD